MLNSSTYESPHYPVYVEQFNYESPHYSIFFTFLVCSNAFAGPYFQIHCIRFLLLEPEVRFKKCRQNIAIKINIEIFVFLYVLFVLCRSLYCLYVNVYCSLLLPLGGHPIAVKYIISYIIYHIVSYHIISYHIIYHIISYHIISYHIISYHIISYHIIECSRVNFYIVMDINVIFNFYFLINCRLLLLVLQNYIHCCLCVICSTVTGKLKWLEKEYRVMFRNINLILLKPTDFTSSEM